MNIPRSIFDRLKFIAEAKKSFDDKPKWLAVPNRSSQRLVLVVALRLNGVLRGGVSIRMTTPVDAWEEDVYGHLEVRLPGMTRALDLFLSNGGRFATTTIRPTRTLPIATKGYGTGGFLST